MKKLVALLVALCFVIGVGMSVSAAPAVKKAVAKKAPAKKKVAKKPVKKAAPKKAAPAPAPVAPAPPPPPVAPIIPKAPAVAAAPTLFGWGLNTQLTGAWIGTGKGSLSGSGMIRGDLLLDDFIGLGPLVGLSANAVKYTLGGAGVYGGGGMKAIPLMAGGIINLPADAMGGLETYLAGGVNYVVYGNGSTSGNIGGDIYVGMKADIGMGKTGFALGYSIIRSKTVSDKAITLAVSQPIGL